ncbi:MAG: GAF domain-containing sensor histidine kinase, partial [bacterium]|nr:GAF domain-containing sensor histidine kinase [bacterium]
ARAIKVDGTTMGEVEVCYRAKVPPAEAGCFLAAERHLLESIAERIGKILKRKGAERDLIKRTKELRERNKELNCLYGISRIVERRGSIDGILQGIVTLIPASWQYPDIAAARITTGGRTFQTPRFRRTRHRLARAIKVDGTTMGEVEVCYRAKVPPAEAGCFLAAERHLLESIAKRIGVAIELHRAEQQLRLSHMKLRELIEHLQSAREEERHRLAREIHDEMGQALAALKMDVRWLRERFPRRDTESLRMVRSIERFIDITSQNVQRIASELRPVLLDDFGLPEAIRWQVGQFRKRAGIRCRLLTRPGNLTLDHGLSLVIFRIAQELLTNVIRHAAASRAEVRLEKRGGEVLLRVTDDGRGMRRRMDPAHSFGLRGILERVSYWEGEVNIRSGAGVGTTVEVLIPIPA